MAGTGVTTVVGADALGTVATGIGSMDDGGDGGGIVGSGAVREESALAPVVECVADAAGIDGETAVTWSGVTPGPSAAPATVGCFATVEESPDAAMSVTD